MYLCPNALYRGGGSIAFVAACRLAWLAGHDPRNDDRFVLAQAKNNFARRQPSLAYVLPKDAPRVDWQGTSFWASDDLARHRPRPARRRAREFLLAFLADGPRLTRNIWTATRELGLSKDTLRRAKNELGIKWEIAERDGRRLDYWLMDGQRVPTEKEAESRTPLADEWLRRWHEMCPPRTPLEEEE